MSWLWREPRRDRNLGAALRSLETDDAGSLNPDLLRQRILAAAGPSLRKLRSPAAPQWWEWISRWMPIAVPVGLAASLAASTLVSGPTDLSNVASASAEAGADSTLVIAAFSESGAGSELAGRLVAPASGEWLFEEAVSR